MFKNTFIYLIVFTIGCVQIVGWNPGTLSDDVDVFIDNNSSDIITSSSSSLTNSSVMSTSSSSNYHVLCITYSNVVWKDIIMCDLNLNFSAFLKLNPSYKEQLTFFSATDLGIDFAFFPKSKIYYSKDSMFSLPNQIEFCKLTKEKHKDSYDIIVANKSECQ
jgi:hypothetical protein